MPRKGTKTPQIDNETTKAKGNPTEGIPREKRAENTPRIRSYKAGAGVVSWRP